MHRWFDLVAVLQTDNSILYERLAARGYPQVTAVCMVLWSLRVASRVRKKARTHRSGFPDRPALHSSQAKISENVQCEIMNVVVEEARASYR